MEKEKTRVEKPKSNIWYVILLVFSVIYLFAAQNRMTVLVLSAIAIICIVGLIDWNKKWKKWSAQNKETKTP